MLVLQSALNADGSIDAITAGTITSYIAGLAYVGSRPLVSSSVDDSDTIIGGFRRSAEGVLRIFDASLGVPDPVFYNEGIAVNEDGQVCVVLSATDTDNAVRLAGMAVTNDGRPYLVAV